MTISSKTSDAVKAAVRQEAERISALGNEWQPTYENLLEVVEKARAVDVKEHRKNQREGIQRARDAGKHLGRRTIPVPDNFEEVYNRWFTGKISIREAGALLGVSPNTFDAWGKALRIQKGEPESAYAAGKKSKTPSKPVNPRRKKDTTFDEWCMLSLIRDAEKTPDGLTQITIQEYCKALGWSKKKVEPFRERLIESGRLAKEECRVRSNNYLRFGYRITEAGYEFLEEWDAKLSPMVADLAAKAIDVRRSPYSMPIPYNFDDVYARYQAGELSFQNATKELGVSEPTLRKWIRLRREEDSSN